MKIEIRGNKDLVESVTFSRNPIYSELLILAAKENVIFSKGFDVTKNMLGFQIELPIPPGKISPAVIFLVCENEKDKEILETPYSFSSSRQIVRYVWITADILMNETIRVSSKD